MKIDPSRCPLVILGAWNVAIFNPPFVEREIFTGPEKPRTHLDPTPSGPIPHFVGSDFELIVQADRTLWKPTGSSDDRLRTVEERARSIVQKLSYTPLSAIGINFGFDVDGPVDLLKKVLTPPDTDLIARIGTRLLNTAVRRTIDMGSGEILNLNLSFGIGEHAEVDLNFHRPVVDANGALAILNGTALVTRKQNALEIMRKLYGVSLT